MEPLEGEVIKGRAGRKTKFSSALCEDLIEMASRGKTISHFCVIHSISKPTYHNWKKKYKEFAEAIDIAEEAYKSFIHDLTLKGALCEIDCNHTLLGKMFDRAWSEGTVPKNGMNIHVNNYIKGSETENLKELTAEERRQKLIEYQKQLEHLSVTETKSVPENDLEDEE